MKDLDRVSGVILFLFGLFIFFGSFRYRIGSITNPGAGLFPLILSILLIILSGVTIVNSYLQSFRRNEEVSISPFFPQKVTPRRIFLALISMFAIRYLLPILGFMPSTFLFVLILVKSLGGYNWRSSFLVSALSALVSHFVFVMWLKLIFPIGIFGV